MAALDFPSSPSPGDVFDSWQWDGAKWIPAPGSGGPLTGPIVGVTDGSDAAPGEVGEYIFASALSAGDFNTTQILITTLPAGDWMVSCYWNITQTSSPIAVSFNSLSVLIGGSGGVQAGGIFTPPSGANSSSFIGGTLGSVRASFSVPTQISLRFNHTPPGGSPQDLSAISIRATAQCWRMR